jgi:glycosyltransferase involved in cell wall biosynthesis
VTADHAPVAIFVYNRSDHLRRCLDSLLANPEASRTDVFVFCDGPKSELDRPAVERVRSVVENLSGFASVTVFSQEENNGLAPSIISGVSAMLKDHEKLIVVEDDLVLSPGFLRFINDGLDFYAADERVASIQGYFYPVKEKLPETFFLRGTDCFGWGTWKRAWDLFESDSHSLISQLRQKRLLREFDLDGSYSYTRMLKAHAKGEISSWAVRWHATTYVRDMVSLYPGRSLVLHTGDDELATHAAETSWLNGPVVQRSPAIHAIDVVESDIARRALIHFFRRNHRISWARIRSFAVRRFKNLRLS